MLTKGQHPHRGRGWQYRNRPSIGFYTSHSSGLALDCSLRMSRASRLHNFSWDYLSNLSCCDCQLEVLELGKSICTRLGKGWQFESKLKKHSETIEDDGSGEMVIGAGKQSPEGYANLTVALEIVCSLATIRIYSSVVVRSNEGSTTISSRLRGINFYFLVPCSGTVTIPR